MTRRGNTEGSIYKRTDGRWVAAVSLDHGRRKALYGRTRQEVARKLAVALKARQDGLPLVGDRQTVAQYLAGWLESVKPSLRPRTHERYQQYVRLHALPELGRLPLSKLTPQHLLQCAYPTIALALQFACAASGAGKLQLPTPGHS